MKIKKVMTKILSVMCCAALLFGCEATPSTSENGAATSKNNFDASSDISVVSREDGSGTRGAFIELMGIEEKGADGTKTDKTTKEAIIANKTDVMITNVSNNEYAIGYVSMGSLSASVKALNVDGVEATTENIKNGSYKVSRPFNIATKSNISETAQDFINFILSAEGQKVVTDEKYIAVNNGAAAFSGNKPSGKVVVSGSSSVTPVMEKLKEAYTAINPNASIEIQMSDSTAGMTDAIEGICDIGMASRELKDSEKQQLTSTEIALDGIAVIVNAENPLENITSDDIKNIFTGTKTVWSDISE